MQSDHLSRWLAIGANFGVIVGLVLLIVEIQQNTEMMRAQIHQSRTEAAQSEQQAMYNSEYMPAIFVKIQKGEELTEEELERYRPYIRSLNRNLDNQLWQYSQGLLGENIPRSIRTAARAVIGESELSIEIWDSQKHQFTDEYIAFVDDAISDLRK